MKNHPTAFGVITLRYVDSGQVLRLHVSDRGEFDELETKLKTDASVEIVDAFWGYALYSSAATALLSVDAWR